MTRSVSFHAIAEMRCVIAKRFTTLTYAIYRKGRFPRSKLKRPSQVAQHVLGVTRCISTCRPVRTACADTPCLNKNMWQAVKALDTKRGTALYEIPLSLMGTGPRLLIEFFMEMKMAMPVKRKGDKTLPAHLEHALERLIDVKGRMTADGRRIVGENTQVARPYVIKFSFAELYQLGFKLPAPDSLREVHVKALVDHWIATGKSASTIQNKLTHLRQFAKWIGKPGMVRHTEYYVDEANLHRVRRRVVATESRGWDAKGIDPVEVIRRAEEIDRWTALYLRIMYAFGLRLKEAIHFRPVVDVTSTGQFLSVRDGTKGGRHRMVPIETDYQRETIVLAQQMAQPKNKRIIPAHCTLAQAYQRTRYRMRKLGLTRGGLGVTAHGLRHQYAQNSYESLAGKPSPIQGGDPNQIDRDTHMHVCHEVMQRLGHNRVDIGGTYYGSYGHKLRGTSSPFRPWERSIKKLDYGVTNNGAAKAVYLFVLKDSSNGEATSNATVIDEEKKEEEQS